MSIEKFSTRMKSVGVLYVDVYPFRISSNNEPEFLLLKRNREVVMPNVWQFVSGKISESETIKEAFIRQTTEKTGLKPLNLFKVDFVNTFYDENYDTVMLVPSAAAELAPGDVVLLEKLHCEFKWASLSLAEELIPWSEQLVGLRKANAIVEAHRGNVDNPVVDKTSGGLNSLRNLLG
jgi:8-oxo-dGTP pyrophosphatase MutT (NUDIX family)